MKKNVFMTLLLIVMCIFISNEAFSAWTQPKGHSYNQVTLSYYKTTKKFTTLERNEDDEIVNTHADVFRNEEEEFTSTKITYYGEYGIIDTLTIFGSIPYDWQRSNDTKRYGDEAGPSGIGDINLGLRQSLMDNILGSGVLMSAQAEIKIPEAYDYEHPLTHLSLGDGQYDATLALLFGKGFSNGYAWLNAGYKFRFENEQQEPYTFKPSDQVKVSFGGGYSLTPKLSIRALIEWTKSVGNAKVSNELIDENSRVIGAQSKGARNVVEAELIKDTLALEPNALSAGIDLAYNITSNIQTVISYTRDLDGFGPFKTENYSLGETFSFAFVYMN
jgi:hypothetical protein